MEIDTNMSTKSNKQEVNINCTLAKAASQMLIYVIEKIIEDINNFPFIEDWDEFKLLIRLEEYGFYNHLCRHCDGCLDYEILAQKFNHFFESFKNQYQKNDALLQKIKKEYEFNYRGVYDDIEFMLFLIKKTKVINKYLNNEESKKIADIKDAIELAHYRLSSSYIENRIADCHDIIMKLSSISENQKFNYRKVDVIKKISVYFDQNIIAHYIEDERLKKKVLNLKNNHDFIFTYSSYIIEDAIKMQQLYMKEFLKGLKELTDNQAIIRNSEGLSIVYEDTQYAIDRVNLFRPYTKAAEKEMIYKFMKYHLQYKIFSKKGRYYNDINTDPIKFFTSLKTLQDNDIELKKSMGRILHFECNYLRMSFDENFSIPAKYESLDEKFNLIGDLTTLLNIFNYKTENLSDQRKVMSSLQDVEHIKYASAANYLVTEDGRLRDRAKFIYQVLNIETQVMSLKEFEQFSNEILKKTHIFTTQQQ